MRHVLSSAEDVVDEQQLAALDAAFHRQLAAAADNTILEQMLDALRDLFTDEGRVVRWAPLVRDWDAREHAIILDAMERRDPVRAADAMRAHLEGVRDALVAVHGVQRTA